MSECQKFIEDFRTRLSTPLYLSLLPSDTRPRTATTNMSATLHKEVQAINLKYGGTTIVPTFKHQIWSLCIPHSQCRLLLHFPSSYTDAAPEIEGIEEDGESFFHTSETQNCSEYWQFEEPAKLALNRVFVPGQTCLDQLITEIERLAMGMKSGALR